MFVILFIYLFILELFYIKVAKYCKIFAVPNDRNLHHIETVRGGGIIFWITMLLYFLISNFLNPYFFVGLTLISIISFWDDIAKLSIQYRLFVHFISTSFLLFELNCFSNPVWWILSLIIFGIGIINAVNFMDGINGMTVGTSIIMLGSLWFINNYHQKFIDNNFIIYALLSLVVFFFFNFRTKAICFAGDVGSISIGFIIVFLLFKLILQENNTAYILFLGVYGVDSVLTIFHRLILKENIFKGHRNHLYQVIVFSCRIPQLLVATIYMMLQLIISIIVILNLKENIELQSKLGIGIVIILSILYITIKWMLSKNQRLDLLK